MATRISRTNRPEPAGNSQSRGKVASCLALAGAVLFSAGRAGAASPLTVYDNYQRFPIGGRAAGMGGASYTALACDEAALHYNPAALACAASSRLELSANAYVVQGYAELNAIGKGNDISAVTYHPVPTIVGGVRVLSEGDPTTKSGELTFGLQVSVPQSVALKIDSRAPRRIPTPFPTRCATTSRQVIWASRIR